MKKFFYLSIILILFLLFGSIQHLSEKRGVRNAKSKPAGQFTLSSLDEIKKQQNILSQSYTEKIWKGFLDGERDLIYKPDEVIKLINHCSPANLFREGENG